MRRSLLLVIGLTLAAAPPLHAGTFARASIAPDLGLDAFTRGVARAQVGRDVFSDPWATVTISNVDVYDRFPYVEARNFEIVSDPRWNRLVCGEAGRSLRAYDGAGGPLGSLSEPRGMAVDEQNRVYVADAGHDRVVVLRANTEYDAIDLVPLYAIGGLSHPYAVAYSDGGTPFVPGDDVLYVADTGRNRIVAFALGEASARQVAAIGDLGSGAGRFAGPMAIATGRANGASTRDVYVADAHNRRIVQLRYESGGLTWIGETADGADVVTSLDTDQWGNVYAAAPRQGVVRKFNSALEPVAELSGEIAQPKSFHLPFANVRDHRDGSMRRVGQPNAVSVDRWSDASGVNLWNLGVTIAGLGVVGGDQPSARYTLTDQADVTLEIRDAASGRVVARRAIGTEGAGAHSFALLASELGSKPGASDLVLRLSAASSYADGASDVAQASFSAVGNGSAALPSQPVLLGSWPNPGRPFTRIGFALPQSSTGRASLGMFDVLGRRVRTFAGAFSPGMNEVIWDGTDDNGHAVGSGLYFYRLDVGSERYTGRLTFIR